MRQSILPSLTEQARLRPKNQLTLPERVVDALGARPGDRLLLMVEDGDSVRVVRVRETWGGTLRGAWGASEADIGAHLSELRESWTD